MMMARAGFTQETRDEVVRNPLNDSTSKNLWSFPRDKRFKSDRKYCPYIAYDYELSTNNRRNTSFGYGRRTDFKLNNKFTPSPAVYEMSGFTTTKSGKTFGTSRQRTHAGSYVPAQRMKNPGPGDYQIKQVDSSRAKGFSMRPKTAHDRNYFIEDLELASVPGPGRYDDLGVHIAGKNYVSKFRSVHTPNLLNSTSKRFQKTNDNPGPGNYFRNSVQTEPSSMQHTSTAGTIGRSLRISFTDGFAKQKTAPGPGNYRLPSDFGHYLKM